MKSLIESKLKEFYSLNVNARGSNAVTQCTEQQPLSPLENIIKQISATQSTVTFEFLSSRAK